MTACAQAAGPTTPVTLPTEFAATPDRASTEPAATAVVNSADTPAPSATKGNPAASGAVVVLQRSGGLEGTTDEWAIFADGSGQHASDGQAPVTTAGVMSPDEVERLVADIQALGFFAMADDYGRDVQCADCFHYGLTVARAIEPGDAQTPGAARLSGFKSGLNRLIVHF